MPPDPALTMRMAARAMHRHGLAHAYGHVSARLDDQRFLVSPPQPLGTVEVGEKGVEVPVEGDLPAGALPEVVMHQEIYRRRPSVRGIARVQPPAVIALSALGETPRARHGLGSYFAPCAPLWPGVALVRDRQQASQVAEKLGEAPAIVLAGNGCVCAAPTLEEAACLAFFLEDAARLELAILPARTASGVQREYTADEARTRAVSTGGLFERMWQYLCFGDPEWRSVQ